MQTHTNIIFGLLTNPVIWIEYMWSYFTYDKVCCIFSQSEILYRVKQTNTILL